MRTDETYKVNSNRRLEARVESEVGLERPRTAFFGDGACISVDPVHALARSCCGSFMLHAIVWLEGWLIHAAYAAAAAYELYTEYSYTAGSFMLHRALHLPHVS